MMKYVALLFLLIPAIVYAQIPPGKWQCFAFDTQKKSYEGIGDSQQHAMQAASQHCKRKTKQTRCKTAQSFCEQGPLSLIEDRCLVSDSNGRSWNATGKDACKVALSLCTEWQFLHGRTSQCSVKHR